MHSTRYAHTEGFTEICFTDDAKKILTCGEDGDVRIWQSYDDSDSVSISVGEKCTALGCKNSKIYVANENNEVKKYDLNTNEYVDVIATFTLSVTCMALSKSDTQLLCGCADFDIRLVELDEGRVYKSSTFSGHSAPILDVCFDPLEKYFMSSSCDGTVRVWSIRNQMNIKTLTNMHPKSNDFSTSKTFSKLSWHKDANLIAIPTYKEVQFYERELWQLKFKIEVQLDESEKQQLTSDVLVSITKFSPDGKSILLCSTPNETVYIHSIITKALLHKFSYSKSKARICSIAWNLQNSNEILFCDLKGQMGVFKVGGGGKGDDNLKMEDLLSMINDDDDEATNGSTDDDTKRMTIIRKKNKNELKSPSGKKRKRLVSENEDDDVLNDDASNDSAKTAASSNQALTADVLLDDDAIDIDELESLEKLKQKTVQDVRYEYDTSEDTVKSRKIDNLLKNQDQLITKENLRENVQYVLKSNLQTFQCTSTPLHLTERYMVWNAVGLIKQFNNEGDKSIDIEFHNVSYHHTIHINNNQYGYTMGDLSKEAVLLACPGSKYTDDDSDENLIEQQFSDSRLVCILLNPWDSSNKEWSMSMPKKEVIKCICVSNILCACFTNHKFMRVFTLSGIQREVIAIPCSQVVCMSAYNNCIFISYYKVNNTFHDNVLSYSLVFINDTQVAKHENLIEHGELALSERARLVWLGFSDEGSPYYYDSNGFLYTKYLNSKLWTPVCNLRSGLKHKGDAHWLVGIAERTQACRTILCKSSQAQPYPTVIPKPTIDLVQLQVPLCEAGANSEKTQLEQDYWKSKIVLNSIKNYEQSIQSNLNTIHQNGETSVTVGNIQFDQDDVDELNEKMYKQSREILMKMFILSCKSNKEQRAYETASLMDSHALQLAIKYATKARYLMLANHLNRLAEIKSNIELEMQEATTRQQQPVYEQPPVTVSYTASAASETQRTIPADTDEIMHISSTNQSTLAPSTIDSPSLGIPLTNTRFNPFKTTAVSQQQTTPKATPACGVVASPSVINEIEERMQKQQTREKENQKEKDVWKPTPSRKLTKSKLSTNTPTPGLDRFFKSNANAKPTDDTSMDE